MNDKHGKNTAAFVRDRLLALARKRGEDFQLLLIQYGLERLLYRLSQSGYRDRFILETFLIPPTQALRSGQGFTSKWGLRGPGH